MLHSSSKSLSLLLPTTLALAVAACDRGPEPVAPEAIYVALGATRVALTPEGDYLAFGGGKETSRPADDGLYLARLTPAGEPVYLTSLRVLGASEAWPIALRVGADGTIWTLSTVYGRFGNDLVVHSVVNQLAPNGDYMWTLPVSDDSGPIQAYDLELHDDGSVLVATGARLLTVSREGLVVDSRDVAAAYGIRIEELETLADGRMAVMGYPGIDWSSAPRLLVLDADGTVVWSRDLEGEQTGGDTLLHDGAGGLIVLEGGRGDEEPITVHLDGSGAELWSVAESMGAVVLTPQGLSYTRQAPTSDALDHEGYPEDVGQFLVQLDAGGREVSEIYLGAVEEIGLNDGVATRDGAIFFGGRLGFDEPRLFLYRP